jgi:ribose/xylose/arabinose/galactoside ABC-type transport system permease subunit
MTDRPHRLLLAVTVTLLVILYGTGAFLFDGFFALQVVLNLFIDNATLAITAIGMTFVILSGGIDLSIGSVIGLTTMVSAALVAQRGWSPASVIPLVLVMGAGFGLVMGLIIQFFRIQPFIVTLAGLFIARGLCYVISVDSIAIEDEFYSDVATFRIPLVADTSITAYALVALAMLAIAIYLAHFTRFGRTVYAIGGNEHSALLMGLPVARTKVVVYTFNGLCSALAGVVFTFFTQSGNPLHAQGLELDAITVVVVGGTLLTGGSGYVVGTVFGVLIYGTIQTMITFHGGLSSWWIKIVIGSLLLVFCLLQQAFVRARRR